MQIVIDIPEEEYHYIQLYGGIKPFSGNFIAKQIKNGTVLPKGHGRLIDADIIQFENAEFDTYGDYSRAFDAIDGADTIIEADREVDNG